MKYSKEEKLKMYDQLVRGRIYADKMEEAVFKGKVLGSLHLPHGQEAIGVGVINAMTDNDWLSYTHRFQSALIERLDIQAFTSELLGKATGMNKGICFDFHCNDMDKKVLQPVATLGSNVPMSAGFAWTLKQQKKDGVVVSVHGDGGYSEGCTYEAFNIATLQKVPIVFVIENNGWGEGTPINKQCVNPDVSDRAKPFNMETKIADGNDVEAVRETMEWALEKARNNEPVVVEFKTYRWKGHFCGDPYEMYMDMNKVEEAQKNCPLKRYEEKLLSENIIDENYIKDVKEKTKKYLDEIFDNAINAPYPSEDEIIKYDWIYADPTTGGEL